MTTLPDWLQEAVDNLVLSEQEAREIQQATESAQPTPDNPAMVELPESTWPAASRLYLWELEASPTLH